MFNKQEYQKEYQSRLYQERRYLLDLWQCIVGCQDCGEHFWGRPEVLDCDHKPGTIKYFNISHGMNNSFSYLLRELEKCDVVCSNCHRTRTVNRSKIEGI
jgi:hypothetical protein